MGPPRMTLRAPRHEPCLPLRLVRKMHHWWSTILLKNWGMDARVDAQESCGALGF